MGMKQFLGGTAFGFIIGALTLTTVGRKFMLELAGMTKAEAERAIRKMKERKRKARGPGGIEWIKR